MLHCEQLYAIFFTAIFQEGIHQLSQIEAAVLDVTGLIMDDPNEQLDEELAQMFGDQVACGDDDDMMVYQLVIMLLTQLITLLAKKQSTLVMMMMFQLVQGYTVWIW